MTGNAGRRNPGGGEGEGESKKCTIYNTSHGISRFSCYKKFRYNTFDARATSPGSPVHFFFFFLSFFFCFFYCFFPVFFFRVDNEARVASSAETACARSPKEES